MCRLRAPNILACVLFVLPLTAGRSLPPGPIIAGYPSDQECDAHVITAATQGVNVIIWSFIRLSADTKGAPFVNVTDAPDLDCVANVSATLQRMGLPTVHMISVGGWGAPHPSVTNNPAAVYASWKQWNEQVVPRGSFAGFDGIDVDMEGANDPASPTNYFTVPCLDTVGVFATLAKADGYLMSLVPPQSYFDVTTSKFDRSLLHAYPDCEPTFSYHGMNAYTYMSSRYAFTSAGVPTFDWIMVQIYESFSRGWCNTTSPTGPRQSIVDYLVNYMPSLYAGWLVDFSSDPELHYPSQVVYVNRSQLVIGLANGWTDGSRAWFAWPAQVGQAHETLASRNLEPRGYGFWDIGDEGRGGLYMAQGLNDFLYVRG